MVRLKDSVQAPLPRRCKISIPVWCDWRLNPVVGVVFDLSYFNSSMVRLKVSQKHENNRTKNISIPVWCDWRKFKETPLSMSYGNFNSSMVRLKVYLSPWNSQKDPTFQFQYGAIEGLNPIICMRNAKAHFNSSMVRLKALNRFTAAKALWNFNSSMVRLVSNRITTPWLFRSICTHRFQLISYSDNVGISSKLLVYY